MTKQICKGCGFLKEINGSTRCIFQNVQIGDYWTACPHYTEEHYCQSCFYYGKSGSYSCSDLSKKEVNGLCVSFKHKNREDCSDCKNYMGKICNANGYYIYLDKIKKPCGHFNKDFKELTRDQATVVRSKVYDQDGRTYEQIIKDVVESGPPHCKTCKHNEIYYRSGGNTHFCKKLSEYKSWTCSGDDGQYLLDSEDLDNVCKWYFHKDWYKPMTLVKPEPKIVVKEEPKEPTIIYQLTYSGGSDAEQHFTRDALMLVFGNMIDGIVKEIPEDTGSNTGEGSGVFKFRVECFKLLDLDTFKK